MEAYDEMPGNGASDATIAALLRSGDGVVEVPPGYLGLPEGCSLDALGVRLTQVGPAFARAETVVSPLHLNQVGNVQGGIYAVLADATAGWATEAFLGHAGYVTTGFTSQLLAGVSLGDILATEATVAHPGRRTVVTTAELLRLRAGAGPRRVALFTCHQLVL